MSIRSLRTEVGRLRQQIVKSAPVPEVDVFRQIEQYAQAFCLIRTGQPIPAELAEVAEDAREYDRLLAAARAEAARVTLKGG